MELIQKFIIEIPQFSVVLVGVGLVVFFFEGRERDPVSEKKIKKPIAIGCLICVLAGAYFYYLHLSLSGKLI